LGRSSIPGTTFSLSSAIESREGTAARPLMRASKEAPTGVGPSGLSAVGLLGVLLAIAGALLDFYSGYQILRQSAMTTNGMGDIVTPAPSVLAWGAGITALGVVLLVTAFAMGTSIRMRRMKASGALMASYGIVMLFIGVSMYWGLTPMMQETALSGAGMLVVGALMIFNGALMWRPRTVM
jgi:hypothetical protein